jgi:hypothetical protein
MTSFALACCLVMCLIAILYVLANGDFMNPDLTCLAHCVLIGLIILVAIQIVMLIIKLEGGTP